MANEIKFSARGLTGATLYAVVLNSAGQAYNGSTFEALNASNWATYDIALSEQASLGIWLGTFPVVAAGLYGITIYQQAGGSPAMSDVQVGGGAMDWTGAREQSAGKTLPDNAAAGASGGVAIVGSAMTLADDAVSASALAAGAVTEIAEAVRDVSNIAPANNSLGEAVNVAAAAGSSGGAGARTVTVTVDDGTNPLENAIVRVIQGVEDYILSTDSSGEAVFALDDATWAYAVTKPGYGGETGSLVVNGAESLTVSLTQTVITPPATPGLSAIEVLCLDSAGQPESGVDVDIRMITVPSGSQNMAFRGTKQTATSDGDGVARFEVVQGSICEWKRGLADVWQRVAVDADGVTNVTSVIGSP